MEIRFLYFVDPTSYLFERIPILFKKFKDSVLRNLQLTFPFKSIKVEVPVKYLVLFIVRVYIDHTLHSKDIIVVVDLSLD